LITWTPALDAVLVQVVEEEQGTWPELAALVTEKVGVVVTGDMARNRYRRVEEARELRANAPRLEQVDATRSDIAAAINDAMLESVSLIDIPPVPRPVIEPGLPPAYAVLVGSDWQMGKLIKGHYDSETAVRRVDDFFDQSAADIVQMGGITEAHVLLLGDLLENESIFPKQPYLIDSSLFRQVFMVAETIVNGIRLLLSVVPSVYVEGIGGNHGYNQKTSHPETNFDCMAMNVARLILESEERLDFPEPITELEEHWYMMHEVGQQTFFGFHGNQVRSQPNTKVFRDRLLGYHATLGSFDYALTGHYHQAMMQDLGAFKHFAAGSTESSNTYAQQWLASGAQQGTQWLLYTDGEHLTDQKLIGLE
jgi:hypothetical protein